MLIRWFSLLSLLVGGQGASSLRKSHVKRHAGYLRSLAGRQMKTGRLGEDLPVYTYDTVVVDQVTDHFSYAPVEPPTFKQRILVNTTHWKAPEGPILFYTGNEGDIESFAQNTGFMWQLAPKLGAMVVFAEHRYYGESSPFPVPDVFNEKPADPKKLQYLSVEQALLDFVSNIEWLKSNYSVSDKAAVIAMGGSYGGMLSAYLRLKYPWAADGALASSAPILQFPGLMPRNDINAFFNIITRDYKAYPGCAESIRLSWDVIDRLSSQHLSVFKNAFNLCDDLTTYDQVDTLKEWLSEAYIYMAMTDYQYPTNFLRPLPGEPIEAACKFFNKPDEIPEDPVLLMKQVANAVGVFYNYTGTCNCQCYKLFDDSSIDVGADGWEYQSCTQFMLPMEANGHTDMFYPQKWDEEAFIAECQERFGVTPDKNWAAREMGGPHYEYASNIIFSNGGRDPWSGGGIMEDISRSVVSLFVPEGAHHLDLRSDNPLDPVSVRRVRQREEMIMRDWIREARHPGPPHDDNGPGEGTLSPPAALGVGLLLGVLGSMLAGAAFLFYKGVAGINKLEYGGRTSSRSQANSMGTTLHQPLLQQQQQPAAGEDNA